MIVHHISSENFKLFTPTSNLKTETSHIKMSDDGSSKRRGIPDLLLKLRLTRLSPIQKLGVPKNFGGLEEGWMVGADQTQSWSFELGMSSYQLWAIKLSLRWLEISCLLIIKDLLLSSKMKKQGSKVLTSSNFRRKVWKLSQSLSWAHSKSTRWSWLERASISCSHDWSGCKHSSFSQKFLRSEGSSVASATEATFGQFQRSGIGSNSTGNLLAGSCWFAKIKCKSLAKRGWGKLAASRHLCHDCCRTQQTFC